MLEFKGILHETGKPDKEIIRHPSGENLILFYPDRTTIEIIPAIKPDVITKTFTFKR